MPKIYAIVPAAGQGALALEARAGDDVVRTRVAPLLDSRAMAALEGRDFITPDDVKSLVPAVLAHRVTLSPEAEMEGLALEDLLRRIFDQVEVPR